MKRPVEDSSSSDPTPIDDAKTHKKIKPDEPDPDRENEHASAASVLTDEDLLYEVLKHADARTVAAAACVNRQWRRTAADERLWELICARHWAHIGSGSSGGSAQLRSVVRALGGFRRLHQQLRPAPKPAAPSAAAASSAWPCPPPAAVLPGKSAGARGRRSRGGKDEMHLSLSLLSIRYFDKMNFSNRGK